MGKAQPNTIEKKWLKRISEYAQDHGSFPHYGMGAFELHHVCGRTARHNKVDIGHFFVLPVQSEYHNVNSGNPFNVTHWRKRYSIEFGNQRDQFAAMCAVIRQEDGELPFCDDVYNAIMDTKY